MDFLCQISEEIINLRYLHFSLLGLMAIVGVMGAYVYVGPVRALLGKLIALGSSVFGGLCRK